MRARAAGGCAVLVAAIVSACGGSPTAPSISGTWGGDHIALTAAASGAHIELDCAHADVSAPIPSSTFTLTGTYVREHGGPIAIGENPDAHPASFTGTVDGSTMTLTIRLTDSNDAIGTFTLTRGTAGRVVKCL